MAQSRDEPLDVLQTELDAQPLVAGQVGYRLGVVHGRRALSRRRSLFPAPGAEGGQ